MSSSQSKKIIYETCICILAIVSVIFAIMDVNGGLASWMVVVDNIIYALFVADYIVRFAFSGSKKMFFKSNLLDLVAILPFSSALRIFRISKFFRVLKLAKLSKLTRLSKLSKFTRLFALSGRMLSRCRTFLDTNGFKYMLMFSTVLIVLGGFLISFFENMTFMDGIWWAFVTATTVGYGDISPSTSAGRIIACALMISGIGLIGALTSTITSFFINSGKSADSVSNDRVGMVLKLYNELNDSEKELFKEKIK